MPILRINAGPAGLCLHGTGDDPWAALHRAGARAARIVVMVHGYKYSPFVARHCPQAKLFARDRWPAAFGAAEADTLVVAFGWHARGTLVAAYDRATTKAAVLSKVIATLRRAGPPVDIVAHSLGTTLALSALPYLGAGDVGRLVLLSAAAHRCVAAHALATPAGRVARTVHVTSRENAVFDLLFERLVPGAGALSRDRAIATVLIDSDRTRADLARAGFDIAPRDRLVSHWSSYARPGVMALNAALLDGRLPLDALPAPAPARAALRRVGLAIARQSGIMRGASRQEAHPHEHVT
ncbi:alpha/beta hydrolase [Sulfitobacter sp. HNIBRBA3233]|uniref:alpha/beta hydrolase n=1 Tax=Sulfitobacter marinivivus TaxID=3158558 RepID=UPI0032DF2778